MIINELFTNYFLWYLKKKNKSLFFQQYGAALVKEGEGLVYFLDFLYLYSLD